jgi:hypothetical protein
MELVGWNVNSFFASTFIGRYNTNFPTQLGDTQRSGIPGAHTYDILVQDENNIDSIIIPADLELLVPGVVPISSCWVPFATRLEVSVLVGLHILFAFTYLFAFTATTISATDTTLVVTVDSDGKLQIYFYRTAGPNEPMPCFLLFKTGPSADDNAGRAAGFVDNEDTVLPELTETVGFGSGFNYVVTGDFLVNVMPFRYMDVNVREVEQDFTPLARIYLNRTVADDPVYVRPCNEGMNTRLLSNPIRRLDRLSIHLTLEDKYRMTPENNESHQLTFDVISLAQVPAVPKWISQRLLL